MKLIISNKEYPIVRANFNIDAKINLAVAQITMMDIEDADALAAEINRIYDGTFSLQTKNKTYTYNDYAFECVDCNMYDDTMEVHTRFIKEF